MALGYCKVNGETGRGGGGVIGGVEVGGPFDIFFPSQTLNRKR